MLGKKKKKKRKKEKEKKEKTPESFLFQMKLSTTWTKMTGEYFDIELTLTFQNKISSGNTDSPVMWSYR